MDYRLIEMLGQAKTRRARTYKNTPENAAEVGWNNLPEYCLGNSDAPRVTQDHCNGLFLFHSEEQQEKATAQQLKEIKEKILDELDNAFNLVRDTRQEERSKGYWYAHIRCALDREHTFLGGCMHTMQDTIDSLSEHYDDIEN